MEVFLMIILSEPLGEVFHMPLGMLALWHLFRDGPLEKWWGREGGEKAKKKFMQGKMPRKKIRAKKKGKKKNSCRRKVQLWFLFNI